MFTSFRWVVCAVLLAAGVALAGPGMVLKEGPGNRLVYQAGPEHPTVAGLARWLASQSGDKPLDVWLEIPVRLELSGQPLQPIASATLGFGKSLPFLLELDDTMMGIPLVSRLQEFCPKMKGTCQVWLQGHWGTILPSTQSDTQVFTVRRIVREKARGESGLWAAMGQPEADEAK